MNNRVETDCGSGGWAERKREREKDWDICNRTIKYLIKTFLTSPPKKKTAWDICLED